MKSLMKYVLILATFLVGTNLLARNGTVCPGTDDNHSSIVTGATTTDGISGTPEKPATLDKLNKLVFSDENESVSCNCDMLNPQFTYSVSADCVATFTGNPGSTTNCFATATYDWYIDSSPVGSGQVFSYPFTTSGSHVVCLQITVVLNGKVCQKRICQDIFIQCGTAPCTCDQLQPAFDFTIDKCHGQFVSIGTIPPCLQNVGYDWYVNGVYSGSGPIFGYTFPGNGTYTVCLRISGTVNGVKCHHEYCKDVQITDCDGCDCSQLAPVFDFNIDKCTGNFYGGGNIPACLQNVTYNWYVNGGYVGSGVNFTYVFPGNGGYLVCLKITGYINGALCEKEYCKDISITDCSGCNCDDLQPVFDYQINKCIGTFFGGGIVPSCLTNVTYNWYVNGGYVGSGMVFSYTFSGNGGYVVCLRISGIMPDGTICEREYCKDVQITDCDPCDCSQLQAYFDFQIDKCVGHFYGGGNVPPCLQNVVYQWYVNNVYVGSGVNFSYTFPGNGGYVVCLRIYGNLPNGDKCYNEYCRDVSITDCGDCDCEHVVPYFDFQVDKCVGHFYGSGNIPSCMTNVSFNWFVNGTFVGTGANYAYTFSGNGTYTVCLHIIGYINGVLCDKQFCRDIIVTDCSQCDCSQLQPDFVFQTEGCTGYFSGSSNIPSCMTNVVYKWYVNSTYVGSGQNFTYTFSGNGTYTVCLHIYGMINGIPCDKEVCKSVTITNCGCSCEDIQPQFDYNVDGCIGHFYGGGTVPTCLQNVVYTWYVNGSPVGTGLNYSYTFPGNGTYTVCLHITGNINGVKCDKFICHTVVVQNCNGCDCKQLIPYYDYQVNGCFIQLIGNNSIVPACLSNVTYNWYVGGSYVGSGVNFTYSFIGNGTYLVCLRITGTMPDGTICEKQYCRSIDIKDCGGCNCEMLQPYFDYKIYLCHGDFYGAGNIPGCLTNVVFNWYVNNVYVGSGPIFGYNFPNNGGYVVCLHIVGTMPDGSICEKVYCRDVVITDCDGCNCDDLIPNFEFKQYQCFGDFVSNSVLPACLQNVSYGWYVNGVLVGTGPSLSYTFPANGIYTVCLQVTGVVNGVQCVKQYCKDIYVKDCNDCHCEQIQPGFVYEMGGCFAYFSGYATIPPCVMGVAYNWFVNGAFVGSGSTLSYNFPSNGSYNVCLVVIGFLPDGTFCNRHFCQTIVVQNCGGIGTPGNPQGMDTHDSGTPMEQSVLLYPNPTSSELNIEFNLDTDGPVAIRFTSTDGKELLHETRSATAGAQRFHMAIPASVTDGFIFVEISAGGTKIVRKVSVVRH